MVPPASSQAPAAKLASVERFFQLSLLGLVASGYLAVAGSGFLDVPTTILVAAGLLLRALLVSGLIRFDLSDRTVNFVTLSYIAFFALDYFYLSRGLLEATVHLVCFLAVMKILTARTNRDYVYTSAIALMELLAAAMLSISVNFFMFLAVYLLCAIGAFTSAEIRRSLTRPAQVARSSRTGNKVRFSPRLAALTGFITAGILMLTVGLFIIIPRTANAAFRHLISPRYHLTGFSNEVTLGQIGEIQKDSRPIMHVKPSPFSDRMPLDLKWRGAALSHFDGKRWTDLSPGELLPERVLTTLASDRQRLRRDGTRISYRVDLNTTDSDVLFIAGIPEFLNIERARVIRTATDGYRLGIIPSENVRYEVSSFLPRGGYILGGSLRDSRFREYLQLPPLDSRIAALGKDFAGTGSDWERAMRLENRLRTSYSYTLDLPAVESSDPLADFLFNRKKGHCEYFASAMAVMLRSMGIPARIVNGFQSGTFNPISETYIIRASDAHSWVEAYLPGAGWVTFDPTPPAPRASGNPIWARVAMLFDAAETFWQEWVVNYDLGRQITIAQGLEERTRHLRWDWWPDLLQWKTALQGWLRRFGLILFSVLACLPLLIPFGLPLWRFFSTWKHSNRIRKGRVSPADATLLYARMLRLLRSRGFQKPPWFTPGEFAATLPMSPLSKAVAEFTAGYHALRFGGHVVAARDLGRLLEAMEKL